MADDRFKTNSQEKEIVILIGVDQMFEIIPNDSAIKAGCLDSEVNFTNLSENMKDMEAGKEAKKFCPSQLRTTEKNSCQELNHTVPALCIRTLEPFNPASYGECTHHTLVEDNLPEALGSRNRLGCGSTTRNTKTMDISHDCIERVR
ncbi:hypothetical protein OUZ56_010345 [Daphnia magna]|uniref:Uncharacterized protein n=1 Tax=Daphnia magna TaxID=35525 RepID=A0ABR0AIH7_9CRUS|nr:hypothetical protein OUZ56_010345 [Daphnia magna]